MYSAFLTLSICAGLQKSREILNGPTYSTIYFGTDHTGKHQNVTTSQFIHCIYRTSFWRRLFYSTFQMSINDVIGAYLSFFLCVVFFRIMSGLIDGSKRLNILFVWYFTTFISSRKQKISNKHAQSVFDDIVNTC